MQRAAPAPAKLWTVSMHPEGGRGAGAHLTLLTEPADSPTPSRSRGPGLSLTSSPTSVISGAHNRTPQGHPLTHSLRHAPAGRCLCATRSPGRPCGQDGPLAAICPCSSPTSLVRFLPRRAYVPTVYSFTCLPQWPVSSLRRKRQSGTHRTLVPGTQHKHFLSEMYFLSSCTPMPEPILPGP